MLQRIIRALKLDKTLYNEVEGDPQYDQEAYMIVAIAAVLSGIGSGLTVNANTGGWGWSLTQTLFNIILAFVGYLVTAYLVFFIGTRFFGGNATYGEMRRTLGYAYAANFIGVIPCIGILAIPWSIATYFVATREGLDLDNTKAALVVVISWVVWLIIAALVGSVVGLGAAGLGAISGQLGG